MRGTPQQTRSGAEAWVSDLDPARVLWVTAPVDARRALGEGYDAVVLDLHGGLHADVLGQCHGLVRGGGVWVLRLPPEGQPMGAPQLAVWPHEPAQVRSHFEQRLTTHLLTGSRTTPAEPRSDEAAELGTEDQRRAVVRLVEVLGGQLPTVTRAVLLAGRGRGKSAALGLALQALPAGQRVAVTGPSLRSVAQVLRFAPEATFHSVESLWHAPPLDVLVVDEAAQLSVPALKQLLLRHRRARVAFASTTAGYEGTGRGFVLRFLAWLDAQPAGVERLDLSQPVRWAPGDPLEQRVTEALALDAAPAPADVVGRAEATTVHAARLGPDRLAGDERLLRDVFGLLVHAHYRTTPSDLQRLLDAPNLEVHGLLWQGRAVAATVLAHEGALPSDVCRAVTHGGQRLRGHALPETLMCHAGREHAGQLRWVRSMRIAVHPALRRRGLARRLVEHVHQVHAPDAFGTLFGATAELLRFRRSVGYRLVRLGGSRGARTGEPSAVMVRPCTAAAEALVAQLQGELSRDLALQLSLLQADGPPLATELRAALGEQLPAPGGWEPAAVRRAVVQFAWGPRPFEAAAGALSRFVGQHDDALAELTPAARDLIRARLDAQGWRAIARQRGETVPVTMRALRRAVRQLASSVGCGP